MLECFCLFFYSASTLFKWFISCHGLIWLTVWFWFSVLIILSYHTSSPLLPTICSWSASWPRSSPDLSHLLPSRSLVLVCIYISSSLPVATLSTMTCRFPTFSPLSLILSAFFCDRSLLADYLPSKSCSAPQPACRVSLSLFLTQYLYMATTVRFRSGCGLAYRI